MPCLFEQGERGGYVAASAFGVLCHLVEALAVVVIHELAVRLHGPVHVVVDYGMAVLAIAEGLPPLLADHLRVVHHVLGLVQDVGAALWGKGVHVHPDDEVGIVGEHGGEVVVYHVVGELQLVVLDVVEVHGHVVEVEYRGVVRCVVHGAIGLHHEVACKASVVAVFIDDEVETADDFFACGVLGVAPLAGVDELGDGLLQGGEYGSVCALYLRGIHHHLGLQLLGVEASQ